MWKQDNDQDEKLDEQIEGSKLNDQENEYGEDEEGEDDETPAKKNKSNWKAMTQKLKDLEKENAELKKTRKGSSSGDSEDEIMKIKEDLFKMKNPWIEEHFEKVKEISKNHNFTLEEAWNFVKATLPKESKTKLDFNIGNNKPVSKKDLKDVTPEEALKLDKEKQSEWRKLHMGV